MKQPHVWVLEMFLGGKWTPTAASDYSRVGARHKIKEWRFSNPSDRFRLVKYVREDAHANR